jgi:hypothetical protein
VKNAAEAVSSNRFNQGGDMPELRIQFCRLAVVATYEQPFGGSWQPLSWRTAERQALQHML